MAPPRANPDVQEHLDAHSTAFFEALCRRWGLRADRYRTSMFRRRQSASLRALRVATPLEALSALTRDPKAAEKALGSVMIGVTAFQRDPEVFDALCEPLLALARTKGSLEAVSVGCSSGAELYTVAILLSDGGVLPGARLTGVDCRPAAIATAREGIYPAEAVATLDPSCLARHTSPVTPPHGVGRFFGGRAARSGRPGEHVQMSRALREACRWHVADAFAWPDALPGAADLILCRNLAIYLTTCAASDLWSVLLSRLSPGALLVVGKTERPCSVARASLTRLAPGIYRKIDCE